MFYKYCHFCWLRQEAQEVNLCVCVSVIFFEFFTLSLSKLKRKILGLVFSTSKRRLSTNTCTTQHTASQHSTPRPGPWYKNFVFNIQHFILVLPHFRFIILEEKISVDKVKCQLLHNSSKLRKIKDSSCPWLQGTSANKIVDSDTIGDSINNV